MEMDVTMDVNVLRKCWTAQARVLQYYPDFNRALFFLSTEALLMRKMPQLDLSTFVIGDWMNLKVIDLTGMYITSQKTKL